MKYYACMYPNGYFVAGRGVEAGSPYETDNPNRMNFWFYRENAEQYAAEYSNLGLKVVEVRLTIVEEKDNGQA